MILLLSVSIILAEMISSTNPTVLQRRFLEPSLTSNRFSRKIACARPQPIFFPSPNTSKMKAIFTCPIGLEAAPG
ncbi:hypothetical protein F4678DRAFT_296285 [Xylaria arbuscula]|nr:hypothetical protein F4678DRAFT_296285 [Xylaria arbuscula]